MTMNSWDGTTNDWDNNNDGCRGRANGCEMSFPVVRESLYKNQLKLVADRLIAFALLMFLLPVLASIAVSVVMAGGAGSPIFRHRRIGKDGRPFACLKFRTMYANADAMLKDRLSRDPKALEEWTAT